MAKVNNATGVFGTLGYSFDDPNGLVTNLSTDAVKHLDSMPPFMSTWQAQDIKNNDVGGYYQNPLSSDIIIIRDAALLISGGSTNASEELMMTANTLSNTANSFLAHTNRLSGVTTFDGTDTVNPYLDQAINAGKTALYITNQTDSISNNAPILGSFTSILIGPQVNANAVMMNTYSHTVLTTPTQNTTINVYLTGVNTFLTTRMNGDITYYTNLKDFINKYNETKKFNKLGETEQMLVMNVIGTDKLKSRIS